MMKKIFQTLALGALLIAAFSVLALEAGAQSKKDQKKARQLVEQGDKAFRQKNYQAALEQYRQAVVLVPNNGNVRFWKGYAHYYLKENDQALAEFNLALRFGYKPLDVYKLRWALNDENKNSTAALADLKEILKLEPNNSDFLVALGDNNFGSGNFREALDAYQKAVLRLPNNADLFFKIAQVQFNLNNTEGQASAAEEAVRKHTQFLGDSYFYLGDARQKQRRFTEAIDAFKRALASKPEIYAAYRNLAELYRRDSRIAEAIDISKKALRLFPNDGNIYTDLSWYYSLSDRHEDAVQAALAGVKLLPAQYLAYTNLCRAYNDTKKPELAITACNNSLRLNPNDGETNFYLGIASELTGRQAEAAKYYKRAVTGLIEFTANDPDYSDGFYLLGNAYFKDNQRVKAFEAYNKCLALSPRFGKARYNIGIIQVLQKNKSGAMEQYNSLLIVDQALAAKLKTEIDKL